jgi:hypothetical protein
MTYSVERTTRGIIVRGAVPLEEVVALGRAWKREGWTLVDGRLAEKLDATLVVTNKKQSREWRDELGLPQS